jgi:hypothetical protein
MFHFNPSKFTIQCERKNTFNSSVIVFSPKGLIKKLAYCVKNAKITYSFNKTFPNEGRRLTTCSK